MHYRSILICYPLELEFPVRVLGNRPYRNLPYFWSQTRINPNIHLCLIERENLVRPQPELKHIRVALLDLQPVMRRQNPLLRLR